MGKGRPLRGGVIGTIAALVILAAPAGASAATIRVETAFDELDMDPNCSLREAVQAANTNGTDANPGCEDGEAAPTLDTIIFSGQPFAGLAGSGDDTNVTGDLDITGGGPLRIDGSALIMDKRIFDIDDDSKVIDVKAGGDLTVANLELNGSINSSSTLGGTAINSGPLTLENTEVTGGTAGSGGGIYAAGDLTLINSLVSGNTGSGNPGGGGGIFFTGAGTLTLTGSTISDNHATNAMGQGGGGILYTGTGSLTVTNSTITDNDTAGFAGGGIFAGVSSGINATITGSTISSNQTTNGASAFGGGGGLSYFGDAGEKLRLIDSTVSGNTAVSATRAGGGLTVFGEVAVVNSTISGNMAPAGSGGGLSGGGGGGAATATVNLISSTVADNTAMSNGPGLYAFNGTLTLRNSIVANGGSACSDEMGGFGGNIVTAGFNVDEGTSCDLDPAMGDAEGGSAGLGPLASNGGPTLTHSIGMASPATNRVPTGSCTNDLAVALTTDQRGPGFARPALGACDAGAFEIQPPPPAIVPAGTTPTPASTPAPAKKCKKKRKKKRSSAAAKKKCKKKRKKRKKR